MTTERTAVADNACERMLPITERITGLLCRDPEPKDGLRLVSGGMAGRLA